MKIIFAIGVGILLAGCGGKGFLEQTTHPERPAYGDKEIVVPPPPPHVDIVNPDPNGPGGPAIEVVTGTWTFTAPPTVTRVERKNGDIDQFSLYNGRPEATDTPFLVITVTQDRISKVLSDPVEYPTPTEREYVLNGQVAREWKGLTKEGAGYCELIVRRPGDQNKGDVCHALALARNEDEQQLALSILATITWKPTP